MKKYRLDELKQIKILSICDTIGEIFEELKFEFSKNNPSINDNITNINISVPITHSKYKEISFTIYEKIKTINEIYEELCVLISNFQKRVKNYELEKIEIIDYYNKGIDELKNSINFYCEQMNNKNNQYENLCQKNKKLEEKNFEKNINKMLFFNLIIKHLII